MYRTENMECRLNILNLLLVGSILMLFIYGNKNNNNYFFLIQDCRIRNSSQTFYGLSWPSTYLDMDGRFNRHK